MTNSEQTIGSAESDALAVPSSEEKEIMAAITCGWLHPKNKHKTIDAELIEAIAERIKPIISKLKSELECERIRLAACGVVALADTPDSASAVRANIAEPYMSASLQDVIRRVDECIELRAKLAVLTSGATYQHIKRGTMYTEVGRGHLQTDQSLTDMAEVVIYRGEDGALWVRPTAEFDDPERFQRKS